MGFLEGGRWKCQFYFYGRGDFSELGVPKSCSLLLLLSEVSKRGWRTEGVGARKSFP